MKKVIHISLFILSIILFNCNSKSVKIKDNNESLELSISNNQNTFINIGNNDSYDDSSFKMLDENLTSSNKVLWYNNSPYVIGSEKYSNKFGGDMLLIKLDNYNKVEWRKKYKENSIEFFDHLNISTDNNIILSGVTRNYNSKTNDAFLIKVKNNGEKIWSCTYGYNENDEYDTANEFIELKDGSIISIGINSPANSISKSYLFLAHIDKNGKVLTKKSIDKNGILVGNSIVKNESEEIIFISTLKDEKTNNIDLHVSCYDTKFNELWSKNLGETSESRRNNIVNMGNDNFLIMNSNPTKLIKINGKGNIEWEKEYELAEENVLSGISGIFIKKTGNNEYILSCEKRIITSGVQTKSLLIKLDETGKIIWNKEFGSKDMSYIFDITKINNSEYLGVGFTADLESSEKSKSILVSIDLNGNPN